MHALRSTALRLCAGLLLLLPLACAAAHSEPTPVASRGGDHVILLHGLGRSTSGMRTLERELLESGYAVHNLAYPSRDAPFDELAAGLADEIERCCSDPNVPVHFVTHSMGGIVLRTLLDSEDRPANLGRVVMLAPPNQGSEWVDELRGLSFFRLAGPAAAQLGTDVHSVPRSLGPVDYELGVLAGGRSWNPLGSWLIPGDDDGTVGVASARIDGMRDFRVLPSSHSRIARSERALAEVLHFLAFGAFRPPQP